MDQAEDGAPGPAPLKSPGLPHDPSMVTPPRQTTAVDETPHVPLPTPYKDQQPASMPRVACLVPLLSTLLLALVASLATHSPSNPTSVLAG